MKVSVFIIGFMLIFGGTAVAERMSVDVPIANIRSEPSDDAKVLWKMEKYHPIEIIKESGDWYYFRDFEGDEGWIFKKLVNRTPTVIVKKDKCNVRSGPGTNFNTLFTVEKGVPFKVIEKKDGWINVEHSDGDKGWINEPLVW